MADRAAVIPGPPTYLPALQRDPEPLLGAHGCCERDNNLLLHMQRTMGNRAVGQALQAKLRIGAPDDAYEKEADQVAEHVVSLQRLSRGGGWRSAGNRAIARILQPEALRRECSCGSGSEEPCSACSAASEAPPIVEEVLATPGKPLERSVRRSMEEGFGYDFGDVRVHDDSRASESARAVDALAWTVGNHIAFGEGQYAPGTSGGDHLLAHELTHTIQQTGGSPDNIQRYSWDEFKSDVGGVAESAEQGVKEVGSAVVSGAEAIGEKAVAGAEAVGSAVVSGAKSVGKAVVSGAEAVGEAVVGGAKSVGKAVVGGAEALGSAVQSGVDWIESEAGKLALAAANKVAGLFGGSVAVTPAGIEITIGDVEIAEVEDETFVLPIGVPTVTLFNAGFEVGTFVIDAWAGTIIGDPSVTMAVGPARLQNIKLLLDPIAGNYSGTAQLYVGSAVSGSVEKANEVRLEAAGVIPMEPPIPIVGSAEAGIRTILRLVGKEGFKETVNVGYSGGAWSVDLGLDVQIGALADLANEAFLRIEIETEEICSVIWPIAHHRLGETGVEVKVPVSISSGKVTVGAPTSTPIAPDSIETDLEDEHAPTHCMDLQELGKFLCGKGKLPPDICSVLFPAKPGTPPVGPHIGPPTVTPPPVTPPPAPVSAPTGRTPSDPIEIQWYKPDNLYDTPILLDGQPYHRKKPGQPLPLPHSNEEIGVESQFLPRVGRPLILAFEPDSGAKGRFNARLRAHGYANAGTDADHNTDLQWAGPDEFNNLWPFDSSANRSAGPLQNDLQQVTFSDRPGDPPQTMCLREFKSRGLHRDHKFFRIRCISLTPNACGNGTGC